MRRSDIAMDGCVAVCCSVLQCVAVSCSVLQCVAVSCSVMQCVAVSCSVLQCLAVCCNAMQCLAVCYSALQCVAVCCNALQCVQVRRSLLQCVTVRCGVLQCVAVCCGVFRDIAIDGSYPTKFSKVGALLHFACEMTTELIVQKFNLARTPLWWMHMWQNSRISEILENRLDIYCTSIFIFAMHRLLRMSICRNPTLVDF